MDNSKRSMVSRADKTTKKTTRIIKKNQRTAQNLIDSTTKIQTLLTINNNNKTNITLKRTPLKISLLIINLKHTMLIQEREERSLRWRAAIMMTLGSIYCQMMKDFTIQMAIYLTRMDLMSSVATTTRTVFTILVRKISICSQI